MEKLRVTGNWWRVTSPESPGARFGSLFSRPAKPCGPACGTLPPPSPCAPVPPPADVFSPATRNSLPATRWRFLPGSNSPAISQTPYQSDFFSDRQNFFETPSTRTRTSSSFLEIINRITEFQRFKLIDSHSLPVTRYSPQPTSSAQLLSLRERNLLLWGYLLVCWHSGFQAQQYCH